jgi:hypothetical protein
LFTETGVEKMQSMKTQFVTRAGSLAACAVMAFAAITAHASEEIVTSGAACQPRSADDREDLLVLVDGLANINRTSPAFVLCPIARVNNKTSPDAFSRLIASLRVSRAENGVEEVTCLMDRRTARGELVERQEKGGGFFGRVNLQVKVDPTDRSDYFVMQCRLPPDSLIISYSYEFL